MRVAIIEDSEIDRLHLKTLLADEKYLTIVGTADTAEKAVKLIDRKKPDTVFLDIHLRRQRGFKVLAQAKHQPLVVITTSHPHYAVQGFAIEAVDYLLKPIEAEALARALARTRARLGLMAASSPRTQPLEANSFQSFKGADGTHLLPVGDILAISGERIYTRVLIQSGQEFLHNRPLREWRELLPKPFVNLDRSTIVNLGKIALIRAKENKRGGEIAFRGGTQTLRIGTVAMQALSQMLPR